MKKYIIMLLLISISISACSAAKKTVVRVGDADVSQAEFLYYLESVKSQMAGTELTSDEDWQTKEIEGKKAIDVAKEKSLDTAIDNLAYIEVGKRLAPLTDSEKKQAESFKASIKNSKAKVEGGYEGFLKEQGVTDDFVTMLCESETYRRKLLSKVEEEDGVTEDELKAEFNSSYRRAKHVLFLTKDMTTGLDLSEDKKAEALKKAEDIYQRALAGEDFTTLANEYSEDPGQKTNPDGYVFTDGEMVTEFTDGVDSLPIGGVKIVQTEYGYHVIKRLALDETAELYNKFFESKKDAVKTAVLQKKLDERMQDWENQLGISIELNDKVYDKIGK
ncbi:MAG: peptidylprolyl isomerase [Clostridia bacterium]|nr:peptidylprolyl isomerase [Clostridia bacterium]